MPGQPRVFIDREIFVRQRIGGISRYFAELTWHMTRGHADGVDVVLAFDRSSNVHLNERLAETGWAPHPLRPVPRGGMRLVNHSDRVKDALLTYRGGGSPRDTADILHATYLRPRAHDLGSASRVVMTLQDMIAEQLGWPQGHPARRGKELLARRCDVVISTTAHTASLARECWGELPTRVIGLGVDVATLAHPRQRPGDVDFPYFLYVGTRGGYKNFEIVPKAIEQVRRVHDVGLVIAGPALSAFDREMLGTAIPVNRTVSMTATEDELAALYQHSLALVFPSRMEGYGLPALEAAAAGTSVLLSSIPVFHELADQWAHFFDPDDADELAASMLQVIETPVDASSLAHRRALLPTWERCALRHVEVYRELT